MGSFNGTGTFVRTYDWTTDEGNGVNIEASRMDTEDDGFATGLSNCITKDGQTTITANIPMNSKKFTGLTNGSARTDSIALGQVQDNAYEYLGENGGPANAYTWTPSPAITAYAAGQSWIIKIGAGDGNTTASTADISGVGSRAIEKSDGAGATTALESGDMVAGSFYKLIDNGTALVLQNPEKPYITATNISDATETAVGVVEIATQTEANTATDTERVITPATAGLLQRPTFSAYLSSNQAISATTETRVNFDTESWDNNSWYDNATNYRFTPLRAGYYLIIASIGYTGISDVSRVEVRIRKNGTVICFPCITGRSGNTQDLHHQVPMLVSMNGSTDYIDVAGYSINGGNMIGGADDTFFQAIYLGGL